MIIDRLSVPLRQLHLNLASPRVCAKTDGILTNKPRPLKLVCTFEVVQSKACWVQGLRLACFSSAETAMATNDFPLGLATTKESLLP